MARFSRGVPAGWYRLFPVGQRTLHDGRASSGAVVKVSSDRPINEPLSITLVGFNWSAGRLIREYTFLLDPPDTGVNRASVAVALPRWPPDPAMVAEFHRAAPCGCTRSPSCRCRTWRGRSYVVQPGDTHRIAMENRPEGVPWSRC